MQENEEGSRGRYSDRLVHFLYRPIMGKLEEIREAKKIKNVTERMLKLKEIIEKYEKEKIPPRSPGQKD